MDKEPIGYYIQDAPDGSNDLRMKMRYSEIWDGPIEYYMNNPKYIVTPIYE